MSTKVGIFQTCKLVATLCDLAHQEMSSQDGVVQEDFEWLESKRYYAEQVANLVDDLCDAKLVDKVKCNMEEDLQSLVQLLADMDVHVVFA